MPKVTVDIVAPIDTVSLGIKDDLIRDFPSEASAMVKDIETYWERNVEKYFSKSLRYPNPSIPHNLRKACEVGLVGKQGTTNGLISISLGEIYSSGGFEYGKVLMNGREPAEHSIYVPNLGISIDTEQLSFSENFAFVNRKTTKGTDNLAWVMWTKDFNTYVRNRTIQFVRQCVKRGLLRRSK